jgi:hypothetical protein
MQKVRKLHFKDFLKIFISFLILKARYFTLIFIMGFNFNGNKIFLPFKTTKWPNLLVFNLVANII